MPKPLQEVRALELNLEKRIVLLTLTDLPRKGGMQWLLTPCFMTCYIVNSDGKQAWIFRDKWIETCLFILPEGYCEEFYLLGVLHTYSPEQASASSSGL